MTERCNKIRQAGFTLIEVMVALAIISIALLSAIRATGQSTATADELRVRLLAGWVARNIMEEHHARGDWLPLGTQKGSAQENHTTFSWRKDVVATPNPVFRRIDIFVATTINESHPIAHFTGFMVDPAETRN